MCSQLVMSAAPLYLVTTVLCSKNALISLTVEHSQGQCSRQRYLHH